MWPRVGQQVRLPTPGQNGKRGVLGVLNLRTGAWCYQLAAHKSSADSVPFLVVLAAASPTGLICLLVDNASIQTSQLVQQWPAAHRRIVLLYLPPYTGHTCTRASRAGVGSSPLRRSGGPARASLPLSAPSATWPNSTRPSALTLPTSPPPVRGSRQLRRRSTGPGGSVENMMRTFYD